MKSSDISSGQGARPQPMFVAGTRDRVAEWGGDNSASDFGGCVFFNPVEFDGIKATRISKPLEFERVTKTKRMFIAPSRIPTGFRPPAQGCEERATLGPPPMSTTTPTGLRPRAAITSGSTPPSGLSPFGSRATQRTSFLATIGWRPQSNWDCSEPRTWPPAQYLLLNQSPDSKPLEFERFGKPVAPILPPRIPTGFRPPAQGCEERATLGNSAKFASTPTGLRPSP